MDMSIFGLFRLRQYKKCTHKCLWVHFICSDFWYFLELSSFSIIFRNHFDAVVYWHSFHHSWFKNVNKLCEKSFTVWMIWNSIKAEWLHTVKSFLASVFLPHILFVVELAIAEMACVSRNVRTTRSESLPAFRSNVPFLGAMSRIL